MRSLEPAQTDITPTLLFNPSKSDFICFYDKKSYVLPSRVITTFPKYLADHMAKHLASKLALEDESGLHFDDKYNKLLEKIYVTIT